MEQIKRKAYRCRQCHTISPLGTQRCTKRGCNVLLNIHGEIGEIDEYNNWTIIVNHSSREVEVPKVIMVEPPVAPPPPPEPQKVKEKPVKEKAPKPVKVKEPKPVKVKEPKPVKVKEPKVKSQHPRRGGLIVLVILLILILIGVAAALVWVITDNLSGDKGSSGSKDKTTDAAKPDAIVSIPVPDFGKYMGDAASLLSSKDKGDYMAYQYKLASSLVEEAVDEYVDLVEGHYPFEMSDGNNTGVWFIYTGKSDVTALKASADDSECHIDILLVSDSNGTSTVEFRYAKELELEDPGVDFEAETPPAVTYEVPDFLSFAGQYATDPSTKDHDGFTVYNYMLPQGALDVLNQYETLLLEDYDFKFDERHDSTEDSANTFYFFYSHTQASSDTTASLTYDGKTFNFHLCIGLKVEASEQINLAIVLPDSFEFVSHNQTTDFQGKVLPDFEEWAQSIVTSSNKDTSNTTYTIRFYNISVTTNQWITILDEFTDLLFEQYSFTLLNTQIIDDKSWYWVNYNGPDNTVSTVLSETIQGKKIHVALVWYTNENDTITFSIVHSHDLTVVDPVTTSTNVS